MGELADNVASMIHVFDPIDDRRDAVRVLAGKIADTEAGLAAAQREIAELRSQRDRLAATLEAIVLPSLDAQERPSEAFEERAEEFRRATGYLAPGKSRPIEMGGSDRAEDDRQTAWSAWQKARYEEQLERMRAVPALLAEVRR